MDTENRTSRKRNAFATALLTTLAFALGFAEFVLIGITPDVAEGLGEPLTLIGDLVGYYALACAVATPIVALATARADRFKVMAALLVVFTAGNLLTLVADGRVLTNIAMILAGAASTYVFYTYLAPILADVVGLDAAGTSLVLLLFGAACVGSNLLSGWVAGRFGLRALPVAFAAHAALLALLAVSLPAGVVSIANILAVGLLMYVMNSTVQMLFQDIARADYPSALTFSASLHPMSFNAGLARGSFAGGLVVNAGGLLATGPAGALFALAAAALALALVRMTARRSVESAAEAARTAATAREPR